MKQVDVRILKLANYKLDRDTDALKQKSYFIIQNIIMKQ